MEALITMAMLSALCIGVLVPQALKSRAERHQHFLDSLHYHAALADNLADPHPDFEPPVPPVRPSSPLSRRRNAFVVLLASLAVSAAAAIVTPGKLSVVVLLGVVDCFLAYVAQLVRWRDARTPLPSPPLLVAGTRVRPAPATAGGAPYPAGAWPARAHT